MKQIPIITIGSPQPIDCPNCHEKNGYKLTQRIQKYADIHYLEDGSFIGCYNSDSETVLHTIKRAHCLNCNSALPFNLCFPE